MTISEERFRELLELQASRDDTIDYSDIPELDDDFWGNATYREGSVKKGDDKMYVEIASANEADNVFEQIRILAKRLTLTERLRLIRDVLTVTSVENEPHPQQQIAQVQTQSDDEKAKERQVRLQKLEEEQLSWYARPDHERELYGGRFVALRAGDIVDSDTDKGALYIRIRRRFGSQLISIIPAEQTEIPTIMIRRSPLEDQLAKK